MELPKPSEGGGDFELAPIGTHLAVCYRVVDLGTQETTFDGQTKHAHKVLLCWELPDEKMSDGRPFIIQSRYTWSMHEKANLRKHLEAWRGVAFSEKDFGKGGFDIKNILGKPCILTVVHAEHTGKTYANVAGVGKLMKGQTSPQQINSSVYLWLHKDRWDASVYASLTDGLKSTIAKSPEYQELASPPTASNGSPPHGMDAMDDEIPFAAEFR